MEEKTRNAGQGLGVAALVLGVISFIVAFIPCIGLFALFTALIAIVLGAIGLSQASRNRQSERLNVWRLITWSRCLIYSNCTGSVFRRISDRARFFEEKIEDVIKDIEKMMNEFEDGNFSITIDDGEDRIEINSSIKKELRDALDELEDLDTEDDVQTKIDIRIKVDTSGRKEVIENAYLKEGRCLPGL